MSILVTIRMNQKGLRTDTVQKAMAERFPDASIRVQREVNYGSRAQRFANAQSMISEGASEIEDLADELREWKENLPENLQDGGDKVQMLDKAISELERLSELLNEAGEIEPEFPGMYWANYD